MARFSHFLLAGAAVFLLGIGLLYHRPDTLTPLISSQYQKCNDFFNTADDDYHQQLATIRPVDTLTHSRTLSVFSGIFVISLERRSDRRVRLDKLKDALRIDWEYVFAVDQNSESVGRILENVRAVRERATLADFAWPAMPAGYETAIEFPRARADLWELDPATDPRAAPALPPAPNPDDRPPLFGMTSNFTLPPVGKGLKLNGARVATWASHISVIRKIATAPDPAYVGLILEDDVDLEWDIEHRLVLMWPSMPSDWEMLWVGHCQSTETQHKAVPGAPNLHPSGLPLCTHAYALTRNGARRLLSLMRYELFAYGRAVDNAYQHMIYHKLIKSYSIAPPIAIQLRNDYSDIWGYNMASVPQAHWLVDSTTERIKLLENKTSPSSDVRSGV